MANSIIGWDLGNLGDAIELPVAVPGEITLVKAGPDLHSVAYPVPITKISELRVWGLHPTLVVAVTFYKRLRLDKDPFDSPIAETALSGKLQAYPIVRSAHRQRPLVELPELPAAQWFLFGGQLYDGFEASSAMQGFKIRASVTVQGPFDHDMCCSIQVKQRVPLGCIDLARTLIANVKVDVDPPIEVTDADLGWVDEE